MNKIKILFDISHGIWGSTGIQQDMRRILKGLLNYTDKFDIDLFVYDMVNNVSFTEFDIKESLKKNGSLITQNKLLAYFLGTGEQKTIDRRFPLGWFLRKRHEWVLTNTKTIDYIVLDKKFNELIYRKLLYDGINHKFLDKIKNLNILMTNFSSEGLVRRMQKDKYVIPYLDTKKYDVAIFSQELPIRISKNTKKVVRSYDLIQIYNPDFVFMADYKSAYQYKSIIECIKQQSFFCAISKTVENELKSTFPGIKTHTIPVAMPNYFNRVKSHKIDLKEYIKTHSDKEKLKLNKKVDYIISVATIEPRKNILTLYKAFKRLQSKTNYKNLKLILVGKLGWNLSEEYFLMLKDPDVIHLKGVETKDLPSLYSQSKMLVYIPFTEGFGLPPMEALACETPIVISDIPVHREIYNNYAYFVNPYDVEKLTETMEFVLKNRNKEPIKQMVKKGKSYSQKYTVKNLQLQWVEYIEKVFRNQKDEKLN